MIDNEAQDQAAKRYFEELINDILRKPLDAMKQLETNVDQLTLTVDGLRKQVSAAKVDVQDARREIRLLQRVTDEQQRTSNEGHAQTAQSVLLAAEESEKVASAVADLNRSINKQTGLLSGYGRTLDAVVTEQRENALSLEQTRKEVGSTMASSMTWAAEQLDAVRAEAATINRRTLILLTFTLAVAISTLMAVLIGWRL